MQNQVDISVLMPVFNGEKYLRAAIGSILDQTFANFELIIIDDGSTDESEKIIREFKDPRLRLIKNETNLGLIKSLNNGLLIAEGNFIARMDADDLALPERFKEQLSLFASNSAIIAVGSDYYSLNKGRSKHIRNDTDSDFMKTILLFSTCFCHPTMMIRNIFALRGISYKKDYVHAEDYKLWTDLAFLGEFANVSKPLLKYRSHRLQVSNAHNADQLAISCRIREEYLLQLGFRFTEEQIRVHHLIGDNVFITSESLLKEIERWLLDLKGQNERRKNLKTESFQRALNKMWLDSCGNSNLGLKAYSIYFKSSLARKTKLKFYDKIKFFSKCLIRRFKKA